MTSKLNSECKILFNLQKSSENEFVNVTSLPAKRPILNVVSMFSGCGGLDLGFLGNFKVYKGSNEKYFEKNPFNIIWANDNHVESYETYRQNISEHITLQDIREIDKSTMPIGEILLGGFPCQDFSISGKKKGLATTRGQLYLEMVELLSIQKPLAFLAENVKNIISDTLIDRSKSQKVIDTIVQDFENQGYNVTIHVISASDYGVPQNRERVFIVGIRKDIGGYFILPKSHHPLMTSKEAIDDLWGRENDPTIFNHSQSQMSLAKFPEPKKMGNQGNYQVSPDKPSQTIRSNHHMNIQGHYRTYNTANPQDRSAWRRLTVRECARLQSFPDEFVFVGNKSQTYVTVGNAVPPILGWYLARALYKSLYQHVIKVKKIITLTK